jgi:tetratricopeptide (TPR) repeat protein
VTQEFHLSVTPIQDHEYIVRTEYVAPGVPLAEEQVTWYVDDWLTEASLLMGDPVMGLLRSTTANESAHASGKSAGSLGETPANLVAFGQRLFNALFQGRIRDSWMMAQGIAQHQHQRLRFRLGLKGTKLHQLPWEVLCAGDRPLTTGTDIIFSRYHSSFSVLRSHLTQPRYPADPNQPLKILLVLAAPKDQDGLALRQEAEQLRQELRSASDENHHQAIDLTILEQPGREQLTQALEHNHFHVLHYAGHSDLGAGGGSLYLVNRQTGLTEVMSGDDLAGLLVNNGIRMAVFNSCRGVYTATTGHQTEEGNLAESLVKRGIPAVLAMAERIPDNVALNLSRLFYRNLKQAYPLDLSLSRTRQGLITSYGSDKLYWALPILYLHPEFDGFLQPIAPASNAHTTSNRGYGDFNTSADLPPFSTQDTPVAAPFSHWQLEYPESPNLPGRSQAAPQFPEFDELEFDDPDPPEEEQVARLVQELSQSPTILEPEDPILPASAGENLLPRPKPNGKVPAFQPPTTRQPVVAPSNGSKANRPPMPTPPALTTIKPPDNAQVYSELTAVLADMGTLTPEIAAGSRAVDENPDSAEAYTHFGWALHQRGYLTEAIVAYNEAIRLNPNYANAFNRIGLAYSQQGKVDEAIRALNQAVKLDPTLTEASTNLRQVLYGQPEATPPTPSSAKPTPLLGKDRRSPRRTRHLWLWGSLGAIAIAALTLGWVYRVPLGHLLKPGAPMPSLPESSSSERDNALSQLDPAALTAIALENLKQGKVNEAQPAIAALLMKPDSLQEAERVLQSASPTVAAQPQMAFLQGMLLWRQHMAKNSTVTIAQVRQLWDQAAQAQPSAQHYNALGFAYYAEGNIERAEQSWYRALQLAGGATPSEQTQPAVNRETLTAWAGQALANEKFAERQADAAKQNALRAEVLRLRQRVLDNDPINFTPEQLSLQWMWSETAIQDWEKLLKR